MRRSLMKSVQIRSYEPQRNSRFLSKFPAIGIRVPDYPCRLPPCAQIRQEFKKFRCRAWRAVGRSYVRIVREELRDVETAISDIPLISDIASSSVGSLQSSCPPERAAIEFRSSTPLSRAHLACQFSSRLDERSLLVRSSRRRGHERGLLVGTRQRSPWKDRRIDAASRPQPAARSVVDEHASRRENGVPPPGPRRSRSSSC